VFDRFEGGLTIGGVIHLDETGDEADLGSIHGATEDAVLDLIAGDEESPALEKVA
jgi:hypothetical protein